jgi:hypothetical protein
MQSTTGREFGIFMVRELITNGHLIAARLGRWHWFEVVGMRRRERHVLKMRASNCGLNLEKRHASP